MQKHKREDIIRERWLRGRLAYKLHAGQRLMSEKVQASSGQLFVGECSRQYGKTTFEAICALQLAFAKPRAKIKLGTAFYTDLVEFVIPAFEWALSDCPNDIRPKYKAQKGKYVFYNGSEIKLVGLDRKPNGLRGTVPDLIILDEAGFMTRLNRLYKSVIIPATTHRPDCKILVFSTPPETPAHDFLDYVAKAHAEGSHCHLTLFENPMIDAKTVIRLLKETGCTIPCDALEAFQIVQASLDARASLIPVTWTLSTEFRREYLCEHVTDANSAIIAEWKDEFSQDVERDKYYQFYHRYSALDLGVTHNTALLLGYYEYLKGRLVIEDEETFSGPTLTTQIISEGISAKEKTLWDGKPPFMRVSDNNNPLLLQDLSFAHGLHFLATDKGTLAEMVNTVKILVRDGGIIVHPRCKQLLGCLKYGVWDSQRKKFAESKVYGHFDHLAALIYLVRNLDRVSNPIPHGFELRQDDQILFPNRKDTANEAALKNAFGLGGKKR